MAGADVDGSRGAASVTPAAPVVVEAPERPLTEAARRALAEAEERRRQVAADAPPRELEGRGGLEPVRYGDWEVKGLASDF